MIQFIVLMIAALVALVMFVIGVGFLVEKPRNEGAIALSLMLLLAAGVVCWTIVTPLYLAIGNL